MGWQSTSRLERWKKCSILNDSKNFLLTFGKVKWWAPDLHCSSLWLLRHTYKRYVCSIQWGPQYRMTRSVLSLDGTTHKRSRYHLSRTKYSSGHWEHMLDCYLENIISVPDRNMDSKSPKILNVGDADWKQEYTCEKARDFFKCNSFLRQLRVERHGVSYTVYQLYHIPALAIWNLGISSSI